MPLLVTFFFFFTLDIHKTINITIINTTKIAIPATTKILFFNIVKNDGNSNSNSIASILVFAKSHVNVSPSSDTDVALLDIALLGNVKINL